jgi:hypothetical protein
MIKQVLHATHIGGTRNSLTMLDENMKGRYKLGNLGKDGRTVLTGNLQKLDLMMQ